MTPDEARKRLQEDRARFKVLFGQVTTCPVLNNDQVQALARLMDDGWCEGTTLPFSEPPVSVQLFAPNPQLESGLVEGEPAWQTVAAVASDGRTWTLTGAGICWPDWYAVQRSGGIDDPVQM
jgi:hypothetical protein